MLIARLGERRTLNLRYMILCEDVDESAPPGTGRARIMMVQGVARELPEDQAALLRRRLAEIDPLPGWSIPPADKADVTDQIQIHELPPESPGQSSAPDPGEGKARRPG